MESRIKYSVLLAGIGILIALLPFNPSESFQLNSKQLLSKSLSQDFYITVDQAARFMNNEDSTVQFIDLRSMEQFRECNIPGSVNIPFPELLDQKWEGTVNQNVVKNIFYGNGDQTAVYAWMLTTGLGYRNNFILKGGLNEWFKTVINSQFTGEKITPAENIRFENRLNARRTFTQINSLPDSLKGMFFSSRRLKQSKLDGGCE
jgi:3-mercaptopyruvate sulfurtransferase SseA